jgi:hypothetical protein
VNIESGISALKGGGNPLSGAERSFFEPRLGADLSGVRVHAGPQAHEAASSINARAFTLGRDIAFARGEYSPGTEGGNRLMSHELAHVVQQDTMDGHLRRKIQVGRPREADDPMYGMDPDERNRMIQDLLDQLGGGFTVVRVSRGGGDVTGEVVRNPDCDDPNTVATGSKPVGNCCLCIMTGPLSGTWTIRVARNQWPHTRRGSGDIYIQATGSSFVSGHWSETGQRVERPRVATFAHELCGHAALHDLSAHPSGSRVTGRRHDPTIRLEHAVWGEQGLPPGQKRGLSTGAVHRGESFMRVVVSHYPFGRTSPYLLPSGERSKLDDAAIVARDRNLWVDIIGHSDPPAR